MTENEAVVQLNFDMEMIRFNPETGETLTLEQIKAQNEANYKTYLADEMAITALIEIQQYRAIGTIEEFKALKEKSEPKKPSEVDEKQDGLFYIISFVCPTCNEPVIGQPYKPKHCKHCGQHLYWSE